MTRLRLRTVDAFTDTPFTGNPAGVVILELAAPAAWMAALAAEVNLSETAFALPVDCADADYELRWFTPATEVQLCGHATLAAAHCLLADGAASPIRFATRSGVLTVVSQPDGSLAMDFPANPPAAEPAPDGLAEALGAEPGWVGRGGTDDLLVELADEQTVRSLTPDPVRVAAVAARGVVVTAAAANPAAGYDFVSRFFAPRVGIAEDPVTGSAHTVLAPFWAQRLGKTELIGKQLSARTGLVGVRLTADRVVLTGRALTILDGTLAPRAWPAQSKSTQPPVGTA